jgi:hypothetical protein
VEVATVKLSEKKGVAVFRIPHSPNRPHYLMSQDKKISYIRVQDRTVQASREVWEVLRKSRVPRDTVFTYGKKEEILMKFLAEREKITSALQTEANVLVYSNNEGLYFGAAVKTGYMSPHDEANRLFYSSTNRLPELLFSDWVTPPTEAHFLIDHVTRITQ